MRASSAWGSQSLDLEIPEANLLTVNVRPSRRTLSILPRLCGKRSSIRSTIRLCDLALDAYDPCPIS